MGFISISILEDGEVQACRVVPVVSFYLWEFESDGAVGWDRLNAVNVYVGHGCV